MLSQTSYYWHVPQLLAVKINGHGHRRNEIEMKINEMKIAETIGDMIERNVWKIYSKWNWIELRLLFRLRFLLIDNRMCSKLLSSLIQCYGFDLTTSVLSEICSLFHWKSNFFFINRDRYEVIEPTTKRPVNSQKPQQDDEYFGGSEFGWVWSINIEIGILENFLLQCQSTKI